HEGRTMSKFTFDHIHLFTRDPEATAAFYERMFGAEVIRSMPQGKPRIDLKLGGANIFILDVSQDPKGANFSRGPETIRPGTRIAFLSGPEGVSIELLERTAVA